VTDVTRKLEGKVAVVTGASKGIGASIAKALADEGAAVVVNYSSGREGADRVVAEIQSHGGQAIAAQGNVSRQADVERLFSETKKAFGRLDILVNNAGVYEFAPLEGVTEALFHKHFDTNVLGLLLTTKEAVKHMGPEGGSIINIGGGGRADHVCEHAARPRQPDDDAPALRALDPEQGPAVDRPAGRLWFQIRRFWNQKVEPGALCGDAVLASGWIH
jgi:3-oxoacyl-[acyl-carrier protein] reductase